jgi:hypothetical protein
MGIVAANTTSADAGFFHGGFHLWLLETTATLARQPGLVFRERPVVNIERNFRAVV